MSNLQPQFFFLHSSILYSLCVHHKWLFFFTIALFVRNFKNIYIYQVKKLVQASITVALSTDTWDFIVACGHFTSNIIVSSCTK